MKSSCFANKKAGYRKRKFGSNASKKKKITASKVSAELKYIHCSLLFWNLNILGIKILTLLENWMSPYFIMVRNKIEKNEKAIKCIT